MSVDGDRPGQPHFLRKLRDRKLVQWAIAYLGGAWLALQLLELLSDVFGWGSLGLQRVTVILAVGLLAVLVVAWYHGERGRQHATGMEILMLAGILVLAGGVLALVDRLSPAAEAPQPGAPAPIDPASVIVLPFADLSPEGDQEYFSDGLTEEILNALVRVRGLRVPARTTSFAFKGRNVPVSEIAHQVRVAHVLEGSVRRSDGRLRITAQLVDARDDRHLWSETYDRELADIFVIQEEIAKSVVAALEEHLGTGSAGAPQGVASTAAADAAATSVHPRSSPRERADPAAYELYLRGLHLWNRRTPQSLEQAAAYFERAVERDSSFARGWAGLALARVLLPEYAEVPAERWTAAARSAALRALALDDRLVEAQTALAWAHALEWRPREALRLLELAIAANDAYPTARQWRASLLVALGRPHEAAAEMERARELDPLSFIITANAADHLLWLKRYDEALQRYDEALELNPTDTYYRIYRALAASFAGRGTTIPAIVDNIAADPAEYGAVDAATAGHLLARAGRLDDARAIATHLEERAGIRYVSPVMRAYLQVALGEHARALDLLEEAASVHDPLFLYYAPTDPGFEPIGSEPRFRGVLARYTGS